MGNQKRKVFNEESSDHTVDYRNNGPQGTKNFFYHKWIFIVIIKTMNNFIGTKVLY